MTFYFQQEPYHQLLAYRLKCTNVGFASNLRALKKPLIDNNQDNRFK